VTRAASREWWLQLGELLDGAESAAEAATAAAAGVDPQLAHELYVARAALRAATLRAAVLAYEDGR
jgi:hypothetical protein